MQANTNLAGVLVQVGIFSGVYAKKPWTGQTGQIMPRLKQCLKAMNTIKVEKRVVIGCENLEDNIAITHVIT